MRSIATIFAFLIALAPGLAHGQTYTVNSTADHSQGEEGVDCADTDAECTLRAAIETANLSSADTINFDIPEGDASGDIGGDSYFSIVVGEELPTIIEDDLLINGKTQAGYQELVEEGDEGPVTTPVFIPVEINGSECDAGIDDEDAQTERCRGLGVQAANVDIEGLTINNFLNQAVRYGSLSSEGRLRHSFIGTTPDGIDAAPNGRAQDGTYGARAAVHIRGTGTIVSESTISGNAWAGVRIGGPGVVIGEPGVGEDITIQENRIGVDIEENELGNGANGVALRDGAIDNLVFDNIIAFNDRNGVRVVGESSIENRISQNDIYGNGGLAIDLESNGWGTPRDNDDGDSDSGPNQGQNFPVIESAQYCPADRDAWDPDWDCPDPEEIEEGFIEVEYYVPSDPSNSAYPIDVEFFRADDSDPAQARRHLGTDVFSRENYRRTQRYRIYSPDANVTRANFMIATATDADGNTSELSRPAEQLPVEFADTPAATYNEGAVVLSWATLSETNNAGFQVQQRVNGGFEDVEDAFIEGHGTSTSLQNYEYTLEGLSAGTQTLRLEQEDFDGTVAYSAEFSVTVPAQLELTEAAPNPFSDQTTVTLTVDESQQVTAEVYDVLGRRVTTLHDGEVSTAQPLELTFDANGLSSGLYLIRVEGETFSEVRRATLVR